jgi:hypothetical protein
MEKSRGFLKKPEEKKQGPGRREQLRLAIHLRLGLQVFFWRLEGG